MERVLDRQQWALDVELSPGVRESVTHLTSAAATGATFWWRWVSPQKRWTPERAAVLISTAAATLWNLYAAVWGP